MATDSAQLKVTSRPVEGSRATRRLRRRGFVPGIVYGGDVDPQPFEVEALALRNTLAHAGALMQLSVDEGDDQPVILKDSQRHPVRGEFTHVDFLRVRMDVKIQATVSLELVGGDEAPGVVDGGVLDQPTRELTVEALPGDLPESIKFDVSQLQINEARTIADITEIPAGVVLVDDPETTIASVMPPTTEPVEEEIETETELVGEDGEPVAEGEAPAEGDADVRELRRLRVARPRPCHGTFPSRRCVDARRLADRRPR